MHHSSDRVVLYSFCFALPLASNVVLSTDYLISLAKMEICVCYSRTRQIGHARKFGNACWNGVRDDMKGFGLSLGECTG